MHIIKTENLSENPSRLFARLLQKHRIAYFTLSAAKHAVRKHALEMCGICVVHPYSNVVKPR